MKRLALLTATALLFAAALPLSSHAQMNGGESAFKIGPRLTLDIGDISDVYNGTAALGVDARYHPTEVPVGGNGALDFYFAADNVTVFTLDLNVVFPVETEASLSPYVGAGLGYTNVSIDTNTQFGSFGGSDTGLNLVGGAEFEVGQLQPFVQGQVTLGDLTRVGITGGLLFAL